MGQEEPQCEKTINELSPSFSYEISLLECQIASSTRDVSHTSICSVLNANTYVPD